MAKQTIELTTSDIVDVIRERYVGYTEGQLEIISLALGPDLKIIVNVTVTPPVASLPKMTEVESKGLASIIVGGGAGLVPYMETKNGLCRKGFLVRTGKGSDARYTITPSGLSALHDQFPGAIAAMRKQLA